MIELERDLLLREAAREFEILILTARDYFVQEGFEWEEEKVLAVESAWGWLIEETLR